MKENNLIDDKDIDKYEKSYKQPDGTYRYHLNNFDEYKKKKSSGY